jgi:hypothetical protein
MYFIIIINIMFEVINVTDKNVDIKFSVHDMFLE